MQCASTLISIIKRILHHITTFNTYSCDTRSRNGDVKTFPKNLIKLASRKANVAVIGYRSSVAKDGLQIHSHCSCNHCFVQPSRSNFNDKTDREGKSIGSGVVD